MVDDHTVGEACVFRGLLLGLLCRYRGIVTEEFVFHQSMFVTEIPDSSGSTNEAVTTKLDGCAIGLCTLEKDIFQELGTCLGLIFIC